MHFIFFFIFLAVFSYAQDLGSQQQLESSLESSSTTPTETKTLPENLQDLQKLDSQKKPTILRSVEFYNRPPERIDIMLAFSKPFSGEIQQETKENYKTIILKNIQIPKERQEEIGTFGIEAIQVTQVNQDLYIILLGNSSINISAAKVVDGYGLRFRITKRSNDPLLQIKEGLNGIIPLH